VTVATNASNGAAAPFPIEMSKGEVATMTDRGAAVANTINTMDSTPRDPFSLMAALLESVSLFTAGSTITSFPPYHAKCSILPHLWLPLII
jgi:hypothetical protein